MTLTPRNTCVTSYKGKALVLTNHLAQFCGSEIVAVEVAELLQKIGYETYMHCNYLAEPMAGELIRSGINVSDSENYPNVFEFDFVWSQHNVLALAIDNNPLPSKWKTQFISVHLSSYEPFELIGIELSQQLKSVIVANSRETAQKISEFWINKPNIVISHNACPDVFWADETYASNRLGTLLVISNHLPEEVQEAIVILRDNNVVVNHVGMAGEYRRICPNDIANADAIVAIGKSVQYSIMGAKPVYCYDCFGGPGWLNAENFDEAEKFNFSGRDCGLRKSASQIANELIEGYFSAVDFVLHIRNFRREVYSLNRFVAKFVDKNMRTSFIPYKRQMNFYNRLKKEANYTKLIRRLYRSQEHAAIQILDLVQMELTKNKNHDTSIVCNSKALADNLSMASAAEARAIAAESRADAAEARAIAAESRADAAEARAITAESRTDAENDRLYESMSRAIAAEFKATTTEKQLKSSEHKTFYAENKLVKRNFQVYLLEKKLDKLRSMVKIVAKKNKTKNILIHSLKSSVYENEIKLEKLKISVEILRKIVATIYCYKYFANFIELFFDNDRYLEINNDVTDAIIRNIFKSGFHHWILFGIDENRTIK